MNSRSSLVLSFALLAVCSNAQDIDSRILLTVAGTPVEAGEFIRMYRKSIEPGKSPSVDEYLQQFVLFKLKVADAVSEGIDTTRAFTNELNGYRTQLSQNYLSDTQSKEKLLKSAYQRSLTDINAWHVLVGLPPDASPEDTIKAWEKATDIRARIVNGEPFDQVARSSSDDKSAMINGGNLGYFTVFQMITPFEDAAYRLKKGSVSQPVKTPYGYHIIKVTDIRPSRGRLKVAHIMKAAPPGTDEQAVKKAEAEIRDIYEKLRSGVSFSKLAESLSDHKESAALGGELDWFGTGEIISEFAEAAFSLKDTGSYTAPVRTLYGWHIIKLLGKKPPRTYEEARSFLESRLNHSYLNSLSRKAFLERLKKEYRFTINKEAYSWFVQNTDTLLIQGLRKYDRSTMPSGNIYSFAGKATTTSEFAGFIEKRGFMINTRDSVYFIDRSIETMSGDQLLAFENSQLEKKYPEFRYLMKEFHDGILLFEISGKRVWNRVTEDTIGLKQYYEDNKGRFMTPPGLECRIYTLKQEDGMNSLREAYIKSSRKKNSDALLLKKFNRQGDTLLFITGNKWLKGENKVIDELKWEKGDQFAVLDGYPAVIRILSLTEPEPLPFEKVQSEMINGYQEYLENSWKEQLLKRYPVKIDNPVLESVKKKLGQ